jgi:hypothetical protein
MCCVCMLGDRACVRNAKAPGREEPGNQYGKPSAVHWSEGRGNGLFSWQTHAGQTGSPCAAADASPARRQARQLAYVQPGALGSAPHGPGAYTL